MVWMVHKWFDIRSNSILFWTKSCGAFRLVWVVLYGFSSIDWFTVVCMSVCVHCVPVNIFQQISQPQWCEFNGNLFMCNYSSTFIPIISIHLLTVAVALQLAHQNEMDESKWAEIVADSLQCALISSCLIAMTATVIIYQEMVSCD